VVGDVQSRGGLAEGSACCAQLVGLGSEGVSFGFGPCRFLAGSKAPLRQCYEVARSCAGTRWLRPRGARSVLDESLRRQGARDRTWGPRAPWPGGVRPQSCGTLSRLRGSLAPGRRASYRRHCSLRLSPPGSRPVTADAPERPQKTSRSLASGLGSARGGTLAFLTASRRCRRRVRVN
jgi:hypothetical protein